MINLLSYLPY